MKWMQDQGLPSHSPATPWNESREWPSTVPLRVVALRNIGESAGVARRIYYEAVANTAHRKTYDEQDASHANSYQKDWYGKSHHLKGMPSWQKGDNLE